MANSPAKSGQQSSNAQTSQEIWHRVGHVEVIIWQGEKAKRFDFDGLDFKFSVTQILGRMPEGNMSVSICGLSQDTANQLVTICSTHEALMKRKTLKLYAGYADPEDKNYRGELLATMDIVNATISSPPPDMWLQITAVYAGWLNDTKFVVDVCNLGLLKRRWTIQNKNETKDKISAKLEYGLNASKALYVDIGSVMHEICYQLNKVQKIRSNDVEYLYDYSAIEDYYGVGADNTIDTPGRTRHFSFSGSLSDMTTNLSESYKVICRWEYREDKKIYLVAYPDPKFASKLTTAQKRKFHRGKTVKFLDVDHGLIGIPKLKDSIKLECRCFLDGKVKAGDYVSVKSAVLPVIYEYGEEIKPNNKGLAQKWGSGSWKKDKDGKLEDGQEGTVKAYQIMKIKYTGHLRGNEWYCDIEARRPFDVINNFARDLDPSPIILTEAFTKKLEDWDIDEKTGAMTYKREDELKKYMDELDDDTIESTERAHRRRIP